MSDRAYLPTAADAAFAPPPQSVLSSNRASGKNPAPSEQGSARGSRPSAAGGAGSGVPLKGGKRALSPRGARAASGGGGGGGGGRPKGAGGKGGGFGSRLTARERMEQLAELLDAGFVSQAEFDVKRKGILTSI